MSYAKWRLFGLGLNELMHALRQNDCVLVIYLKRYVRSRTESDSKETPYHFFFTDYSWCYYDKDFAGQYLYTLNVTQSGIPCVAWWDFWQGIPSIIPWSALSSSNRMYDDAFYPDRSIRDALNYCRNPETLPAQIWCYTEVAVGKWGYCSPEECPQLGWYLKTWFTAMCDAASHKYETLKLGYRTWCHTQLFFW